MLSLGMAKGIAHNGFAITKPIYTKNLNDQIHMQPAEGFSILKKSQPLRVLTITEPAIVLRRLFVGFQI